MSELLREAILGTAHTGVRAASAADALVSKVEGIERERALLLSAAAEAIVRRAARVLPQRSSQLPAAEVETMRASSLQLTAAARALLEQPDELLQETLARMARAGVRLAPELLPLALEQTAPVLRELLRPVLGQRGAWLAKQRPEWAWALVDAQGARVLPADFEQRWSEGNAAERRHLFALARKRDPARGRELVSEAWRQERAEQRAVFAEAFAFGLSSDDQAFLSSLLSDRSALVQRVAARLLWRLPDSEVAQRMLERARAHVRFEPGPTPRWQISLPAEPLAASWSRDGITEKPPDASPLGQRQWWIQQLVAAVPCATWLSSPTAGSAQSAPTSATPAQLVAAAGGHEFAGALLDGLTRAALQYDERSWCAPLWDAWAESDLRGALAPEPRVLLSRELSAQEVAARAQRLVSDDKLRGLLAHLPRPWPEALALRVLAAISDLRLSFREVIPVAALAIPVALLPDALPLPESTQVEYPLRAFVRALADFQDVAALRRSIAAETIGDD
ncbi:MAG TPA: DUF5691 domain-containing protein [Polyangiales bacterium]|nr:DUF5691 domain-containing protein [Polyangiales bacterium]